MSTHPRGLVCSMKLHRAVNNGDLDAIVKAVEEGTDVNEVTLLRGLFEAPASLPAPCSATPAGSSTHALRKVLVGVRWVPRDRAVRHAHCRPFAARATKRSSRPCAPKGGLGWGCAAANAGRER